MRWGCWRVGRDSRVGFGIQVSGAECSNRPLWMLDQGIGMEKTRTVGTRKGWMQSLHMASVRELLPRVKGGCGGQLTTGRWA